MGLLSKLFGKTDNGDKDDLSCNISGHNYEQKHSPNYYAHGVVNFGLKKSFKVKKTTGMKCTKCGKYKQKEERIGRIKVDTKTDELSVIQ